MRMPFYSVLCLLFLVLFISSPALTHAQDDMLKLIEKRQKEIREKEEALKKEEERINALKRDVEERIEKYTRLLNQIEDTLKKINQINDEKLEYVVKAYESMSAEDASARLSAIDEATAVNILYRMKTKKAGAIIAQMEPKRAASITEKMARFVKNFPIR